MEKLLDKNDLGCNKMCKLLLNSWWNVCPVNYYSHGARFTNIVVRHVVRHVIKLS